MSLTAARRATVWCAWIAWGTLLPGVCLSQSGCGGDAPQPGPMIPAGASEAPPAPAAGAAASSSGKQQTSLRESEPQPLPEDEPLSLAADEELFTVAGAPQSGSTWQIETATGNRDQFAVVTRPGSRGDSTTFLVTGDPEPAATGATPSPGTAGKPGPAGSALTGTSGTSASGASTASASAAKLPDGFIAVTGTGIGPDGYPWRIRCERDNSEMVYVPAGGGIQGSDRGSSEARPAHAVFLDAYYIDVYEVTVGQYENYRQAQREAKKPIPVEPRHNLSDDRAPVVGVNWRDALLYSQWAGKELPTEAQWERAARGTEGFDHPWGNGVPIWTRPRTPTQLEAIGSFAGDRSSYGLYDLAGNAREWCSDWYAGGYYQELAEGKDAVIRNPTGPPTSRGTDLRVVKGGDPKWNVWGRSGLDMSKRVGDVGFRCILNPARKTRSKTGAEEPQTKRAKRK